MKKIYFLSLKGVIILVLLASLSNVFAQETRHYNTKNSFWSEINLVGPIGKKKKFEYQLDVQYRRQSQQVNYQPNPNLANIVLNPYQTVFRPWFHFFPDSTRKLRLSVSPIGFWATFGPAGSNGTQKGELAANSHMLEFPEIRSTYQITTYDKIGRVKLQYRARFEFRWVGQGQPSSQVNGTGLDFFHGFPMYNRIHKYRLRLYTRADVALKGNTIDANEFYLAFTDEVFLGLGSKTNTPNIFDQNRAYVGVGYKLKNDIRLELGYLNQMASTGTVKPGNIRYMDFNNVCQLLIIFDNFSRFFEKTPVVNPNPGVGGF